MVYTTFLVYIWLQNLDGDVDLLLNYCITTKYIFSVILVILMEVTDIDCLNFVANLSRDAI